MSEVEDNTLVTSIFEGLNQKERSTVVELVSLGQLEEDFEFCGHTFGLKTLRADEDLAVGVVLKEFEGSMKEAQAWACAHAAMALTHIDHDDAFCPPSGPSKVAFAKARMNYLTQGFYFPVIAAIYEKYAELNVRQNETIEKLRDF